MQELLRFLLVGFVAGWIANIAVRGMWRVRGCFPSVLVGIIGAVGGGFLTSAAGAGEVGAVVGATAGAVILLRIARRIREA